MKTSSLIALLLAATAVSAAPAIAKTTPNKGKQLCEAAAKGATPAPKSVRVYDDQTRASDTTLTFTLRVRNADDTVGNVVCRVDRETDIASLGS